MNYTTMTINDKEYKLKLTIKSITELEKKLGCNPVMILYKNGNETLPTITDMATIFHASLQAYNHGISLNDAYDLLDRWVEDGHNVIEFIPIMIELFQVSGLVQNTDDGETKNA